MSYTSLIFSLGEDIDQLRDLVQKFAANEVAPLAERVDRDNGFPLELWSKLG